MRPLLFTALLGLVSAKTISDKRMQKLVESAKGYEIAMASQPMWFFTQAMGYASCYPTFPLDPYTRKQSKPAHLCKFPDVSCTCRQAGIEPGFKGPEFPVYYSTKRCGDSEIRVAYNLFYQKDGFAPDNTTGHYYDWERVIVVWNKHGKHWSPHKILLSQHDGYEAEYWHSIPNTFNTRDAKRHLGGKNGRRGNDHPKVYVGWAKHSHYLEPYHGLQTPAVQLTPWATRGYDWWYFPQKKDYHLADGRQSQKTIVDLGAEFARWDWGVSLIGQDPAAIYDNMCHLANEKRYTPLQMQKVELDNFLEQSSILGLPTKKPVIESLPPPQ